MKKRITIALVLFSFAIFFSSFAQESVISDSLTNKGNNIGVLIMPDSLKIKQSLLPLLTPQLETYEIEFDLKKQLLGNEVKLLLHDTIKETFLMQRPKFKPQLYFDMGASRWDVPVVGITTTFSPTLNFQLTKELNFFGGISLTQFHNLSYVQSLMAPGWQTKSNIISNGFVGASYRLFDRIILHGTYQRSIFNQLPNNMMMFGPSQNIIVTGASLDVWNGLGVTVDHVWQYDNKFKHMNRGFRYTPYIDLQKFIKFLRQ